MDFVEILETIDRDLGLGLATGNPIPVTRNSCRVVDNILEETPEKESKPYQFREQKFPLAELMYWQTVWYHTGKYWNCTRSVPYGIFRV